MLSSFPSISRSRQPKNDIPMLSIADICRGCLSGAPGDITAKHLRQKKRGTSHLSIKPHLIHKSGP
jgi:hypothetical protein